MPLSPADQKKLYLALADAESGSVRQWLYLELAAMLAPRGPHALGAQYALWLLRHQRLGLALPLLLALGLPGLAPYRLPPAAGPHRAGSCARRAALLAACTLAVLLGLGSLNASRQALLLIEAGLGGLLVSARAGMAAHAMAKQRQLAAQATSESLTTPEAALGLAGLLVAAGDSYTDAASKVAAVRAAPDAALDEALLQQLGLAAPATFGLLAPALLPGLAWMAGSLAIAWPCWLTGRPWQLLPALMGLVLVGFVFQQGRSNWWRLGLRHVGMVLQAGALAWLAGHYLR